jgi:hypothetical protein
MTGHISEEIPSHISDIMIHVFMVVTLNSKNRN